MIEDIATRRLGLRFGADRLCLWCLCGNKACRRARACVGEPRHCARLIADWFDAIKEERRLRGDVAAMERELKTMEEVRAFRAWRKELDRAFEYERNDPAVERMREELARMVENLCKTTAREREREEAERKAREEKLIFGEGERGEEKNY